MVMLMSITLLVIINSSPTKVAFYNGEGAQYTDQYFQAFNEYNKRVQAQGHNNLILDVDNLTHITNNSDLVKYDVVFIPGGDDDPYYQISNINSDVIRSFVKSGHGYVGVCAGAFSGATPNNKYDYGYGVAPHVIVERSNANGWKTDTDLGFKLYLHNGPWFTITNGSIALAMFTGKNTAEHGACIVEDHYGSGLTILFSPHPEKSTPLPSHPELEGNAINIVAGKLTNNDFRIDWL